MTIGCGRRLGERVACENFETTVKLPHLVVDWLLPGLGAEVSVARRLSVAARAADRAPRQDFPQLGVAVGVLSALRAAIWVPQREWSIWAISLP